MARPSPGYEWLAQSTIVIVPAMQKLRLKHDDLSGGGGSGGGGGGGGDGLSGRDGHGGAAANTYTNPILAGDWPDPGAIHLSSNGSFLVATTGGGFALHRSDNLGKWNRAGSVFDNENTPRWAKGNFWAPEIHVMPDGSYNVYHTASDSKGRLSIGT